MLKILLSAVFVATAVALPFDFFEVPQKSLRLPHQSGLTYRLPNNSRPLRYDLELTTNLHLPLENPKKFSFSGKLLIHVKILETSNYVTVHSRQLRLLSAQISNDRGETLEWFDKNQPEVDAAREFWTFRVRDYLYRGEVVTLEVEYSGILREDNGGFYRSSYVAADGERRWLATTQFQLTDARHAFPCYDEPQIRAVHGISIVTHKDFGALTNMPATGSVERPDGMKVTTFQDTPPMQTYILAFVVSDFHFIGRASSTDVPQRVWGRPDAIANDEGEFGLDAGRKILKFEQEYFGMKYDLPKMDQIAIPDFAAGAMENWGLITYKEPFLLYDGKKPSLAAKQQASGTIAHELAHQFFGNLVAPDFWTYLWLNEGFATLYQYKFSDVVTPELRSMDYFIPYGLQFSLQRDATEDTRPMTTFIDDFREFYSASSYVVYQKAGSVLRMLELGLTEETFRKGISYYLEAKKYGAADSDDLARGLERAAREDETISNEWYLKDIVDSWSLTAHYPIVTVTQEAERVIVLEQKQFSYVMEETDRTWIVPVTFASASNPDFDNTHPYFWFEYDYVTMNPTAQGKPWAADDWIVVNVQQMGYFRVNYEEKLWLRLVEKLLSDSFEDIHYSNRAQLVDDALNVARADLLSYYVAFQVSEYMSREKHFVPWMSFNADFSYVNRVFGGSEHYEDFKKFINDLVSGLYADVGIEDRGENEPITDKTKRTIAINWACLTGDESCVADTARKLVEDIEDPEKELEGDLRPVVYCNGLRNSDTVLFQKVLDKLQSSQDQAFRRTIISSLGCANDAELQQSYLQSTLTREEVEYREQEKPEVLNAVITNGGSTGARTSIAFLRQNFRDIQSGFVGSQTPVKTASRNLAQFVTSESLLKDYSELLEEILEESLISETEKEQFLASAQTNVDWLEKNEEEITDFLNDYFGRKSRVHAEQKSEE